MEQNKKLMTVVVLVIIVLLLAFFGYKTWWPKPAPENVLDNAILQAEADRINPFNQEAINPFEKSTNPYENIKVNPFE